MHKNSVPRLRFQGFAGEWERKTLGEVSDVRDGTHDSPIYQQQGFPLITSKNLTDSGLDFSNVSLISQKDYDEINKRSKVDRGDILLGLIGTIGKPVLVSQDGYAIKNVGLIKELTQIKNMFLLPLLQSSIFDGYISQKNTGNTQKFLGLDTLRKFEFLAPTKPEQTALGNFFRRLDETLAQARARLAKTQQLKRAMLAKLFPAHGETAPKLRFQGFSGEWERRALGEVVNVFDNLRIPVAENARIAGSTPYFGANGIQDYVDGFTHDGEFVLIAEDGANDLQNYPVQYFNGKGWVNNHAHVLQGKPEFLNNLFLFSRFQSMDISRFLVGGGRAKLNGSTMLEIEIEFPKDKKEQTAIGNFFQKLDQTLALQMAELEKLTRLKKALLAAMLA